MTVTIHIVWFILGIIGLTFFSLFLLLFITGLIAYLVESYRAKEDDKRKGYTSGRWEDQTNDINLQIQ